MRVGRGMFEAVYRGHYLAKRWPRFYLILHECFCIGWSMQMSRFLFLNRAWDKDRDHMDTYSSMVVDHAVPHSVLIFPGNMPLLNLFLIVSGLSCSTAIGLISDQFGLIV